MRPQGKAGFLVLRQCLFLMTRSCRACEGVLHSKSLVAPKKYPNPGPCMWSRVSNMSDIKPISVVNTKRVPRSGVEGWSGWWAMGEHSNTPPMKMIDIDQHIACPSTF